MLEQTAHEASRPELPADQPEMAAHLAPGDDSVHRGHLLPENLSTPWILEGGSDVSGASGARRRDPEGQGFPRSEEPG